MRFLPRLALLCGALFLVGVLPRPAAAQSGAIGVRGDVNADGAVTAADALAVLSHVVGKTLPAGYTVAIDGDADGNGQVTALDALVILSHVVGKDVARYPVGRRVLSTLVGPGGGTVVSRADSIRLEVPEGAVTEAVVLTVEPAGPLPPTAGLVPGSALELKPDGQRFAKPVRLTLRVDPAALRPGVSLEALAIHKRVGEGWEEVAGAAVDAQAGTVSALLEGFSTYAVIERGAGLRLVKESGDDQTGTVGQPPHDFLVARVLTPAGQGVPNQELTWTVVEGGGSIRLLEDRTDAAGRIRAVFTLGPQVGVNRVQVSGRAMTPVVFTAHATSSAPTTMTVTAGADQTAVAGSAVATPPSVRVTDAQGNPVPNVAVTFAVAAGGGSVTGSPATTDGSGVATLGSWTLGTVAGTNTLTASVEDGPSATLHATGIPGAAATMAKHSGDGGSAVVATTRLLEARVADAHGNGVAGVTVNWAVATGGGSVAAASSTTDAAGVASVVWTFGTTVGAQSVTATSGGLAGSPLSFAATATPAAAAQLALAMQPSTTAQSGAALAQQPVVQLQDAYGNAVAQGGVEVTAAVAPGTATLGGTTAVSTDAAGQAAFTDLVLSGTVGSYTLGFSAAGLTGATSGAIALEAGAPAAMAVQAGDGQTATVGTTVATAPAVRVTDASGNPVPGVSVAFAAASGGGSVAGSPATTDASGVATVGSWTLGTAVGANTLSATAGALSATFTATGTADAPANIAKTAGDGQTATVGSAVATAPSVTITDQYGNPVPGVSVTFAASGDGSVTGSPATTDASGVATVGSWTLATTVGANALTASAGALSTTFNATGTVGAPANIAKTAGDGQTTTVGTAVGTAPAVTITDQYGNPVPGVSVTFAASGDGSVTGSPATTDASGVATVGSWTLATTVGANTLTVSAGALSTTFNATGTVGAAANITKTAGDGQTATVGSAVATAPSVTITDQYGNPVPGVSVTFAASGDGSVTGSPATTNASGVATVGSWTLATTVGANTLTASAGALSTSFNATGTAGAAANIAKIAGDGQVVTVGTAVGTAPSVAITDQYGNPVAGVSVTFAASGDGSVTGSPATTDASGVATVGSWTLATAAGANTLTASAGALSTTFNATGTVGAAANIAKTAGDGQTATVGSAVGTAPSVTITDQYGNPVPGVSVTFAASGDGSVTGSPATTNASGVATVGSWTLATTVGANTLTASAGALSTTFNATGTAGAAANIAKIAGDGQAVTVGTAVATAPSVAITDQYGNPVAGVSVTFAASGDGSVTGSPATTDASGVATVGSWTLATTAGANTLTVSAGALSTTFNATGTVGAAANIAKTAGDGQTATVGSAVGTAPSVTITDQYGNPVPGVSVTFAASGDGSVTGSPATTDASGVATVSSWTLATTVGANTLTASAGALSTTFNATGTAGAAANIARTAGDGQTATVGSAVGTAPAVTITDQYGNPVAGVSVTFTASGDGSVTGSPATTDASGVATVGSWTLATTVGANTLTASAGALSTTFSATGTPGAAASVAKSAGDAQTATAGSAAATAPAVTVTDAFGNPVPGVEVTFAVASGGGSVTGATQTTGADGIAAAGSWTLGTTAGANTLTATAGELPAATFTATGVAGPAATLAAQAGDGGAATVGSTRTLEARVTDAHGNPVQGHTVSWAVASGGGSVGAPTSTTDAAGVASAAWTLGTGAGAQSATASAAGLAGSPLTFAVTATPAASSAASSTVAASPESITADGAAASTVTVQLRDAYGNPLTAGAGTVALASTGGTLSAVTDNGDGSYTAILTAPTATGTATVSGTLDGAALGSTATVAFVPGAPARYEVTADTATVVAGEPVTVTARLVDAHGNAVPAAGRTVTWSSTDGGSFASPTGTTDAAGVTTVVFTTSTTAGATHTVTADDGAVSGTSGEVRTQVGAPAAITRLGADGVSLPAGSTVTPAPGVRVIDAHGNGIPGVEVTFTVTSGGGAVTGASQTTNSAGEATVGSWTLGTVAGANTLDAAAGALSVSFTATGTVGPASPAGTQITTENPALTAGSITTVTVRVKDQHGNDVATGGAAVVLSTSLGTLGPVTDHGDGSYTADLTHTGADGDATVTGTLDGAPIADDAQVAFRTGGIQRTWTGLAGSGWSTAGSWSPRGVPTPSDTIVVNGGGTQPRITDGDKTVLRLVMTSAGGTLDLGGFRLTVTDDAVATQGVVSNGTVVMSGSGRTLAGTVPNLAVTGSVTAAGNVTANGAVRVTNGTLTIRNQTLTIREP